MEYDCGVGTGSAGSNVSVTNSAHVYSGNDSVQVNPSFPVVVAINWFGTRRLVAYIRTTGNCDVIEVAMVQTAMGIPDLRLRSTIWSSGLNRTLRSTYAARMRCFFGFNPNVPVIAKSMNTVFVTNNWIGLDGGPIPKSNPEGLPVEDESSPDDTSRKSGMTNLWQLWWLFDDFPPRCFIW